MSQIALDRAVTGEYQAGRSDPLPGLGHPCSSGAALGARQALPAVGCWAPASSDAGQPGAALPASSPASLGLTGRLCWCAAGSRAAQGCSAGRGAAGLGGRRRPRPGSWDAFVSAGPVAEHRARMEAACVPRLLAFLELGSRLWQDGSLPAAPE